MPPHRRETSRRNAGLTLVELALSFLILAILASLGLQSYAAYLERARVAAAKGDLRAMAEELSGRMAENDPLPATLDEIGWGDHLDPWGHPYEYVPIAGYLVGGPGGGAGGGGGGGPAGPGGPGGGGGGGAGGGGGGSGGSAGRTTIGDLRKDRFLVPINTDFDLYSVGADGETQLPLTVKVSRDDVIRANNGAYYGLARDY